MSVHEVAVISDTHGILRPELLGILPSVELILHGGDISSREALDRLEEIVKVVAVRGNCDRELADQLPKEILFDCYGRKIYMVHNKKQMSEKAEEADIIIYGHSHKYEERKEGGKLWLNPGSGGPQRFGGAVTMAVLSFDTETGGFQVRKINLSGRGQRNTEPAQPCLEFGSGDLQKIVEAVMRDLEKGKSVERIMKTRKISRRLTEQICQIYFTHPGIDVQGVLNRMEIAGM